MLVAVLQVLQPLGKRVVSRVARMLVQPGGQRDRDLVSLVARIGPTKQVLEQLRIDSERVKVASNATEMDVLVDQLDHLGPQSVLK